MITVKQGMQEASRYSNEKILLLREMLFQKFGRDNELAVVTVGSIARREASAQSDLDFFIIYLGEINLAEEKCKQVRDVIASQGFKMPAADGVFNELIEPNSLLKYIGGLDDTTETLTRRMLFLFECEWLYNQKMFNELRESIIDKYVSAKITQHQLCLFLLNDLIRYYRTICVDFEFKTSTQGKSWGDRSIKLLYSRKFLYFSGVISIAETVQCTFNKKRSTLLALLSLTPIERIDSVCGAKAEKVMQMYDKFLLFMADSTTRAMLNRTTSERENHCEDFRDFKNDGHHFSWALAKLLVDIYDQRHPIHHALIF